ncbi:MAG: ABC transporter ATP-binding protein [Myxococcales bacterium]|nr:ABC transporter ATP-binding protein [Myxococcales bacterium]
MVATTLERERKAVISVSDLTKAYRTPFRRKKVQALGGVSFDVRQGEIFGFLGPNGAGKTTTIRILMGLIHATSGKASIFGNQIPSRAARARLGFLPEHPYFYDYLTVEELCDLSGRIYGVDAATRKQRANQLISRVGLDHGRGKSLRKFSKGMMQRAGLAQALMNDPELVVLDEPMSGLDPIGRKEVRDLIVELKARGKTVFFSTHILNDVETIADRVAIVAKGVIRAAGTPQELVAAGDRGAEISYRDGDAPLAQALLELGPTPPKSEVRGALTVISLPPDISIDAAIGVIQAHHGKIARVEPRKESLEDVFMRHAGDAVETFVP